jgi:hypothetical protein
MTNTTPILAIDVDGVLSPSYSSKALMRQLRADGFTQVKYNYFDIKRAPGSTWSPLQLWLHPQSGELLREFSRDYDVELVWATMWEGNANTVIAPVLDLPRLDFVDFHANPDRWSWKYPAMIDYAAGRPLAWLDDSFGRKTAHAQRAGWAAARRNVPTLCQQIDPRVGMTYRDLDDVADWLHTARLAWGLA